MISDNKSLSISSSMSVMNYEFDVIRMNLWNEGDRKMSFVINMGNTEYDASRLHDDTKFMGKHSAYSFLIPSVYPSAFLIIIRFDRAKR